MTILKEGKNCWRKAYTGRLASLIDGAAYFEAMASAVEQAKKSVYIAAWDIDSHVDLLRRGSGNHGSNRLGDFLNSIVKKRNDLNAYILAWDFPMLYIREREWLPIVNMSWKTHRRIHFELDDQHPMGGSQHQKIVVIDDAVAFCGGIDLTRNRWDTPQHLLDDPRRKDSDGKTYPPFHDVQMIVDGKAAKALGELFRDRWKWATGKTLAPIDEAEAIWPSDLSPCLTDTHIGIVRTLPAFKTRQEVRETEKLYCDAIDAASESIYIENQYLSSVAVANSIKKSLQHEKGPEIVLVLPKKSSGWLEQSTMDAIRAKILTRLYQADHTDRLRVLYPALADGETPLYVHSKNMVVDHRLAVVGSANLSNRSMGLDSECSLALESENNDGISKAVTGFRNKLIAEHLDSSSEAVRQAVASERSLIRAIESLNGSDRSLLRLTLSNPPLDGTGLVPDIDWLDQEKPVEMDRIFDQFVHEEKGESGKIDSIKIAVFLLVLLVLGGTWQWTPLLQWVSVENLTELVEYFRDSPLIPFGVIGAFVVGGVLMVPITVLIGVTGVIFPAHLGVLYALVGCVLNSLVTYLLGVAVGRNTVRKIAGRRLNRLSKQLALQGILKVAVVRNLPVAPFSIVNMVAGASQIDLKDFLAGTALGILPGVVAITVFAGRVVALYKNPDWFNIAVAAAIALALVTFGWLIEKRLRSHN
jgi:phosphatidylserine/phosphatidylglycerophosphate/cardiolipin synthase-like enzyme/uncharacterized membrane protein YdjX (TVP38/TMEM64 family)